jgi:hypothetical protein
MTIKEELEKYGFNSLKHTNERFMELKEQFMEMGQLKSDFDIEKFTVRREGDFIAHNFHFLMRQYSLALSELRRMLIDKEEHTRRIDEAQKLLDKKWKRTKKIIVYEIDGKKERYIDLYIRDLVNRVDMLDIQIVNKAMMVRGFEACRLKLIEMNGGKAPTNEQYQAEMPEYWRWFLTHKAKQQATERITGISQGVWENIRYIEEDEVINLNFHSPLTSLL